MTQFTSVAIILLVWLMGGNMMEFAFTFATIYILVWWLAYLYGEGWFRDEP